MVLHSPLDCSQVLAYACTHTRTRIVSKHKVYMCMCTMLQSTILHWDGFPYIHMCVCIKLIKSALYTLDITDFGGTGCVCMQHTSPAEYLYCLPTDDDNMI